MYLVFSKYRFTFYAEVVYEHSYLFPSNEASVPLVLHKFVKWVLYTIVSKSHNFVLFGNVMSCAPILSPLRTDMSFFSNSLKTTMRGIHNQRNMNQNVINRRAILVCTQRQSIYTCFVPDISRVCTERVRSD